MSDKSSGWLAVARGFCSAHPLRGDACEFCEKLTAGFDAAVREGFRKSEAEIYRLRDALEQCRNLTRYQETSPDTVKAVGERVAQIVFKALERTP